MHVVVLVGTMSILCKNYNLLPAAGQTEISHGWVMLIVDILHHHLYLNLNPDLIQEKTTTSRCINKFVECSGILKYFVGMHCITNNTSC